MVKTVKKYWGFPPVKILSGGPAEASKAGYNGRHTLTGVKVFDGVEHPAGTLIQEIVEWKALDKFGWMLLAVDLLFFAIMMAVGNWFGALAFAFGAPVMAFVVPRQFVDMSHHEVWSHTLEAVVAVRFYGWQREVVIRNEAASLRSYDWTKKYSMAELQAKITGNWLKAEAWVTQNEALVQKWVDRLPEKVAKTGDTHVMA